LIEKVQKEIRKAFGGKAPKVLDPFGGGGSIPLEALRLGCEVYSNDYNPVAVLIQKCTLEYPPKFRKIFKKTLEIKEKGLFYEHSSKSENGLIQDVEKWSNWVLEEAKKEID
jgi:putative DNA methylase